MMPVLGALVLQAAYGAVDLLVVGRFGTTAGLSAVSTGSQILNLVTFVITQFAMGITVLIARYIGAKKVEQIGELLGGAVTVFTIICIIALLWVGDLTITFKPFSISLPGWYKPVGIILFVLAMAVYNIGEYAKGYKHGFDDGIKNVLKYLKRNALNGKYSSMKAPNQTLCQICVAPAFLAY